MRHGTFAGKVTRNQLHSQVYVHVTACVDSRNELNDPSEERVTRARQRLESDLVSKRAFTVQEPKVRRADPIEL